MSTEQIRRAVSECLLHGNGWPPTLPEFISLGNGKTDYDAAYFRCLNRCPKGKIELWVYQNASYNVRIAPDNEARRTHRRFMNEAEQLDREGKLTLPSEAQALLAPCSVKNLNDLKREEYDDKHGHKINARIQAIIDEKKRGQEC
jgi:hypothetical protein